MPPILELSGVTAGYGPLDVLYSLDLPVAQGKVTAVLGPNGAGKTTMLKVAAGLVPARAGSVRFAGEEIATRSTREIARRGLCLIPEGRGIFPSLSVRENLKLQSKLSSGGLEEVEEIAYGRFPRLGQRRKQIAGTLSGGEQQMLALSRALTTEPSTMMIDEISMGLAPNLVEELFGVVADLAREGSTILLVEQLAEYTLEMADFAAVMAKGRVAAFGEPADVRELLADLYLGTAVDARLEAAEAEAPRRRTDDESLWATPQGSLAHRGSCLTVTLREDVRRLGPDDDLAPCAVCQPTNERLESPT
jgi:branched-chain amino acid transport system ATP-binding protein